MAWNGRSRKELIALGALLLVCAWLVKRNLLSPTEPAVLASLPRQETTDVSRGDPARSFADQDSARSPGNAQPGRGSRAQTVPLDPTLRRDLLERSRQIEYGGSQRNIFQAYTPPPPAAPTAPLPPVLRPTPSAPPAPTIPLKFYGVAEQAGTSQKKAFLTDGEEIFIGHEGDLVAKSYRIVRIGVNSIELEDTRSRQRQSLPLQEGE